MKHILHTLFVLLTAFNYSAQKTSKIEGFAPNYVGEEIEIYTQDDFLTNHLTLVGSTIVAIDSTFSTTIELNQTQQVYLTVNNNKGFILVEPGKNYDLYVPDKDAYEPNRPLGNPIEIGFYNLDSTDVNFKIIDFQFEVDDFLGRNFHLKKARPIEFVTAVDSFKTKMEIRYINDSSLYFKTFVKFTFAGIDNIQTATERNPYEKYDFYLKKFPVSYYNEPYMEYVKSFYKNYVHRLNNEFNQKVYEGVLKSSPTDVMKALGLEYTLSNLKLRELVMLIILKDEYKSRNYPETNVITILDSLSKRSLFREHEIIAKNLRSRLTELVPGSRAPDFALTNDDGEMKLRDSFKGKHLYIHFYDPKSLASQKEIPLLNEMYERYNEYVEFITIYRESEHIPKELLDLPWPKFNTKQSSAILEDYQVQSFPQYCFIDLHGYIISSPSLRPTPNGQYDTIDRVFFELKKEILRRQKN